MVLVLVLALLVPVALVVLGEVWAGAVLGTVAARHNHIARSLLVALSLTTLPVADGQDLVFPDGRPFGRIVYRVDLRSEAVVSGDWNVWEVREAVRPVSTYWPTLETAQYAALAQAGRNEFYRERGEA